MKKAAVLGATGEAVGCAFYSLGSATHLVGQNIGQQITQLSLLWVGCEARITLKQHAASLAGGLLGIGAGRILGAGIGWLLEDAEEGFWSRLLREEDGSFGPQSGPIPRPGGVPANNFRDYENGIRELFTGNQSLAARTFTTEIDGVIQNGQADAVTTIDEMPTAVEAKYTADWDGSIYNPESPVGPLPFAQNTVQEMINQANLYSQGFDGGVIYYTNSEALAAYYTQAFQQAGITNFQFVITSAVPY